MTTSDTIQLRTVDQLTEAHEWLFGQQRDGKIDAKTADGLNTTLKGAIYLRVTLRLKIAEMGCDGLSSRIVVPCRVLAWCRDVVCVALSCADGEE